MGPPAKPGVPVGAIRGFGFVGGVGDTQIVIIQQIQTAPAVEPVERTTNKVYVYPKWVDGGHGVQILQPGYWTEPKPPADR